MIDDRDLGAWILPQPPKTEEYIQIPRFKFNSNVPFGYKVNPENEDVLEPVKHELDALAQALIYLKTYPATKVAAWLTTTTGRSITPSVLLRRVRKELSYRHKVAFYKRLADKFEIYLNEAIEYEKKYNRCKMLGAKVDLDYNPEDEYVGLRRLRELIDEFKMEVSDD